MLIGICSLIFVLIIWFQTDAFVEYIKLFKLGRLFHINEYNNMEYSSYPEFLQAKHNTFFTRLISCPFCVGFWLALIIASIDSIVMLPVIYCGGLVGYFGLVLLAKKSYD